MFRRSVSAGVRLLTMWREHILPRPRKTMQEFNTNKGDYILVIGEDTLSAMELVRLCEGAVVTVLTEDRESYNILCEDFSLDTPWDVTPVFSDIPSFALERPYTPMDPVEGDPYPEIRYSLAGVDGIYDKVIMPLNEDPGYVYDHSDEWETLFDYILAPEGELIEFAGDIKKTYKKEA